MSDFYEAFYRRAKEAIPEFLFDQVKAQALPLSGANARWKSSIPTIFEKLALPALQPENLGQLKNAELKSVIRRIDKLYRSARRAKEDTAMFQKAAAWVVKEMKGRNLGVDHKLAVLQEFVGKSDEEIAEGLKEEVTKRGLYAETDNTGAPINDRGFNVGETFALVQEHGRWEQEASNYKERSPGPYKVCGACRFFLRDPETPEGTCQVVKGPVNWFGTSDLYVSAEAEAAHSFARTEHAVHEAMMDQAFGVEKAFEGDGSNESTEPQKPKMVITVKELIQKRIKRDGDEYVVTDSSGKKELGRHPTRAAAIRQLAAVEANKKTKKTEKAGPTVSQVHTPGSDGKKKDPMGALKQDPLADNVTNDPASAEVKKDETELDEVEIEVPIAKIDDEQRKAYGVVLEPDEVDTQGDTITAEEIEKAAEGFMKKARNIGLRHRKIAKGVTLTDSYVTQGETKLGKDTLKKGTWIIGVKIENDAIWQGVKNGEYTGFSVGGFGQRKKNA